MATTSTMATTSIMDLDCFVEGPPKTLQTVIDSRLERELPFPHGMLLPGTVSAQEFGTLDEAHQDELAIHKCPSGRLMDGLIMLVRALMVCGIDGRDKRLVKDTRLWDIAAHRWGYKRYNDFAMKGHLFAILRDTAGAGADESYDPSVRELLHHPLVVATIWGHPHMQFYQQDTTIKNEATGEWEMARPNFLSHAEQAIRLPFRLGHDVDLGPFFAAQMSTIVHGGREYALASEFPNVIPVLMGGTRPFNDVRVFELEGNHWAPELTPGTVVLKPKFYARYVLSLVLNMSNGDARHYHTSTCAICESLAVAPGENKQHKHARARSNATWNFEAPGSPAIDFLLLFRRVPEYGGTSGVRPRPYTLPTYDPMHTWAKEYVDPTTIFTEFILSPVQRIGEDNPMAMWALQMGPRGSQSAHSNQGSMIAQASAHSSQSTPSSQGSMIAQASATSAQSP